MDVLIESTRPFEKALEELSEQDKALTVNKINDCASLFPIQRTNVYRKLHRLPLLSDLNGYESSLYTLEISEELRIILTVDEDPIFRQVIFTLFQLVKADDLDQAYRSVADSLYQDLLHQNRQIALVS